MSAAVRMTLAARVDADAGLDADSGDTSLGVRPRFSFIATGYGMDGGGASFAWGDAPKKQAPCN
jgi:hypothetical protein